MIVAKINKERITLEYFLPGTVKPNATLLIEDGVIRLSTSKYIKTCIGITLREFLPITHAQSDYFVRKQFDEYCKTFDFFGRTFVDKFLLNRFLSENFKKQEEEHKKVLYDFYHP